MNHNIKNPLETIHQIYTLILENQELIEALDFIMSDPEELVKKFEEQEYPIIFPAARLVKLIKSNNHNLINLTGQ